jgi:hypothetical protein
MRFKLRSPSFFYGTRFKQSNPFFYGVRFKQKQSFFLLEHAVQKKQSVFFDSMRFKKAIFLSSTACHSNKANLLQQHAIQSKAILLQHAIQTKQPVFFYSMRFKQKQSFFLYRVQTK